MLPSEDKLLVRQLDKLVGSQISVQGRLQRMDPRSRGNVPPGELYMTGFNILDQTNNQKPACLLTLSKADKFYGPTTSKSGPSSVQKAYVDATGRVASFETDDLNWLLQHGCVQNTSCILHTGCVLHIGSVLETDRVTRLR
ncbi:MAG: hypothetical protein K2X93_10865 [Candidatus Obscuribacterales bacterium]|nr:hypothetical protein [Candidatus Obscuribacterales bacterium]